MQLREPIVALLFAGAWAGGIYDGWKHGNPYKTIDCAARMPEEPCMAHDCYGVRGYSARGEKRELSVTSYLALREAPENVFTQMLSRLASSNDTDVLEPDTQSVNNTGIRQSSNTTLGPRAEKARC